MSYLNVAEVESAMRQLSINYSSYCTLINLPYRTHEGRRCTALKISYNPFLEFFPFQWFSFLAEWLQSLFSGSKKSIICIGGQHAREWVPPDALIYFCQSIIRSLHTHSNIRLENFTIAYTDLKDILKKVDVVVFPQVNPDGRNKTMTTSSVFWRKNLRPNSDPEKIGVDLNRNYDFLWNFPEHFSQQATVQSSINESDEIFIGPSPLSEPETRNVRWLVENQKAGYFVDVHSAAGFILYNWADDQSQSDDSTMNFRQTSFASVRGIKNDTAYREYITSGDSGINAHLARDMATAIRGVRNHQYTVQEWIDMYAASGTSTDYFQSLFYRGSPRKIHAFCIECGKDTFQPDLDERAWIIKEVTAALLKFISSVALL